MLLLVLIQYWVFFYFYLIFVAGDVWLKFTDLMVMQWGLSLCQFSIYMYLNVFNSLIVTTLSNIFTIIMKLSPQNIWTRIFTNKQLHKIFVKKKKLWSLTLTTQTGHIGWCLCLLMSSGFRSTSPSPGWDL